MLVTGYLENMNAKELIHSMLIESTGKALGDSGGDEGRHWQHNQKEHPKDQPELAVDDYGVTVNIAHYLPAILETDELCEDFNEQFAKMSNWDYGAAYGVSTEAGEWLEQKGFEVVNTWNTYNGESILSQTLQGSDLKHETMGEGDYILLQIHQGADVRGGYTDAKMFKLRESYGCIDPMPLLYGYDPNTEASYRSENGYDWDEPEPEDAPKINSDDLPDGFEVTVYAYNAELFGKYYKEAK